MISNKCTPFIYIVIRVMIWLSWFMGAYITWITCTSGCFLLRPDILVPISEVLTVSLIYIRASILYAYSASFICVTQLLLFIFLMYCNMWSFDYVLRKNSTLTFLVKNENTIQSSFMSYVSDFLSFSLSMNPGFFHHHWSLSAMNIMKDFIMNLYHSSKLKGICHHFSYLYQLHYLACWLG